MNNYSEKFLPHYKRINLQKLYELNELENIISFRTMDYHYNILHWNYEKNLADLKLGKEIEEKYNTLEKLMQNLEKLPKEVKEETRFFGGGLINHNFFFRHLTKFSSHPKNPEERIDPRFLKSIQEYLEKEYLFDNFSLKKLTDWEKLKIKLVESALKVRGSGWTWLVLDLKNKLKIINTENQDGPWSLHLRPLIAIDVWEHAYYLDYGANRKEYVQKLLEYLLNWEYINELYLKYTF